MRLENLIILFALLPFLPKKVCGQVVFDHPKSDVEFDFTEKEKMEHEMILLYLSNL